MIQDTSSELTVAMGELATIALFFGMRACEFNTVPKRGKTKLLQLEDVRFFTNRKKIEFNQLHHRMPDSVTVTFYRQKNGVKEAEISMHKCMGPMCPVRAFRSIILRILSYQDTSEKSEINTVKYGNEIVTITSKVMLQHIKNTVDLIGEESLGFGKDDVGIHSIRSSFAMFLTLNGTYPEIVQLQGRWKSQSFMDYIRPQISDFSRGLSTIMMHGTDFYTVPDENPTREDLNLNFKPKVSYINNKLFNQ